MIVFASPERGSEGLFGGLVERCCSQTWRVRRGADGKRNDRVLVAEVYE